MRVVAAAAAADGGAIDCARLNLGGGMQQVDQVVVWRHSSVVGNL